MNILTLALKFVSHAFFNFVCDANIQRMLEFDFRLRSTASRWTKGGVKFLAPSAKKHQRTVSSFTCVHCNNTNVVGVLGMYHSITLYYQSFALKVHTRRYTPDLHACLLTDIVWR